MKVFDPQGEYTDAEIRDALHGIDNSRKISYRYERLDKSNKLIEEIDYVAKCSIENNFLADIKRTAKFDMYDTGSFNFLSDRIKPYIRVEMPKDINYYEELRTSAPVLWYKLDEPSVGDAWTSEGTLPADRFTYNLVTNAYELPVRPAGGLLLQNKFNNSARTVLWTRTPATTGDPTFCFRLRSLLHVPQAQNDMVWRIWFGTLKDGSDKTLIAQGTFNLALDNRMEYIVEKPQTGHYFFEQESTSTPSSKPDMTVEFLVSRLFTMNDSSENRAHAKTISIRSGGTGLINNQVAPPVVGDSGNFFQGWSSGSWRAGDATHPYPYTFFYSNEAVAHSMLAAPGDTWYIEYTTSEDVAVGRYPNNRQIGLRLTASDGTKIVDLWTRAGFLRTGANGWSVVGTDITIDRKKYPTATRAALILAEGVALNIVDGSVKLIKRVSTTEVGVGQHGKSVSPARNFPQTWTTAQETNIPLGGSISINYWIKLPTVGSGHSSSTLLKFPQGHMTLKTNRVANANTTSFIAVLGSTDAFSPFAYTGTLDVRSVLLEGEAHMVTITVDPQNNRIGVYIDGSRIGWMTQTSGDLASAKEVFATSRITGMDAEFATVLNPTLIDDFTVHSPALKSYQLSDLAESGRNSKPLRRGWVEWSQGVFLLSAPSRNMDSTGGVMRNVEAYDQLLALKEDSYQTRYSVAKGTKYTDAIRTVLRSTISGASDAALYASPSVTPNVLEWEPGTPKLTIINDLLSGINYDSATFDEDGNFVAKPYVSPSMRPAEYTYATDSASIITGNVNQTIDLFNVPNAWTLMVSVPEAPPMVAKYVNDNPNSVTSTVSRGRTIVDVRTENNVASQADLNAKVLRLATDASQIYEHIEFETGIMPIHQNSDVYYLVIDGLVINDKYSETSWSMDLENGATMKHSVRRSVAL